VEWLILSVYEGKTVCSLSVTKLKFILVDEMCYNGIEDSLISYCGYGQLSVSSRSAHCLSVRESMLYPCSNASLQTNKHPNATDVEASAGNAPKNIWPKSNAITAKSLLLILGRICTAY
jgi:hypothetical protein